VHTSEYSVFLFPGSSQRAAEYCGTFLWELKLSHCAEKCHIKIYVYIYTRTYHILRKGSMAAGS